MANDTGINKYNVYNLGYSKSLIKEDDFYNEINQVAPRIDNSVNPANVGSGSSIGNVTLVSGFYQSANYVAGVSGWQISADGNAQVANIILIGGTIKYGKTSFTDATHAGYYQGPEGTYFGAASDVSKLKYSIADGTFDFIGTISSRSTAVLAGAIDSSGHFIDDNFDTAAKNILGSFTFGVSGALQIGTYSAGVSGDIKISPTGILARNSSNSTTFALDVTTGNAIFAGTLNAASGTFGNITAGTLTSIELISGAIKNTYTAGENITSGDCLCIKNSYTDYVATNDSYTDDAHANTNYGTAELMYVKASAAQLISFIKFDVSSIPATGNIQRAILRVRHSNYTGTGNATVSCFQITSADWAEGTIVHTGHPTGNDFDEDRMVVGSGTFTTWIEFDITRIVRGWKETGLNNYGIMLTSNSATCQIGFDTSEVADASLRPHIRVWNNIASDNKVYKASEPAVGYFSYNTVKHIVGFAAETKNTDEAIKVYDTPGSISGLSIGNVVAGTIIYAASSGAVTTDPTNIVHLTQVGLGKGTGNILFSPMRPLLIEKYPINDEVLPNLTGDGAVLKLFAPYDATKCVIYYTADDSANKLAGIGSLTVYRVGLTGDDVIYRTGYDTSALGAVWVNNTITLTNYSAPWLGTAASGPFIRAYFYSR
jgi:hypothetical protein